MAIFFICGEEGEGVGAMAVECGGEEVAIKGAVRKLLEYLNQER